METLPPGAYGAPGVFACSILISAAPEVGGADREAGNASVSPSTHHWRGSPQQPRLSGKNQTSPGGAACRKADPMPPPDSSVPPVVETKSANEESDLTLRALHQRIRQQEILAELGVGALQEAGFEQLLADTARLTAEGLRTEFCKVLEYVPAENRFLVRAGVGWESGIVGVASVGADLASPAGFALKTGRPVISNHLETRNVSGRPRFSSDMAFIAR